MALQTGGQSTVDVDHQTAFAFVRDPERLARCIPGCQDLREISPTQYAAVLSSQVGFMTLSFKVLIDVLKIDPPHAIQAKVTGDAVGLSGRVAATASLQLSPVGPTQTLIRYDTDVALTGKLGGIGQPVFRSTSAHLAKQFGANLKAAIEGEPRPAPVQGGWLRRLLRTLLALFRRPRTGN
jgi:carbon monoxide dehydrogenase subunit G